LLEVFRREKMLLESGHQYSNTNIQIKKFISETTEWNPNFNTSGMLLAEAYYGKNPILKQIEKHASTIRDNILSDANPYYNPEGTHENSEIEKLFAKLFNVEDFHLSWMPSMAMANAFTPPVSLLLTTKYSDYDIRKDKNGVQFKKPDGKIIMVTSFTSLFRLTELTPSEWVAVILHEVGHNFYVGTYSFIVKKLLIVKMLLELLVHLGNPTLVITVLTYVMDLLMMTTKSGRRMTVSIDRFIDSNPALKGFKDVLNTFTGALNDLFGTINGLLNSIFMATGAWVINLPAIAGVTLSSLFDSIIFDSYRDEKFADNFATSFGYGPEMASVAKKFANVGSMDASEKIVNKIPVYRELYNANRFIVSSIVGIGECHPDDYQRVSDQAKMLRSEMNKKGIPANVKKQMQKDLKEIEEIYSQMNDMDYMKENHQTFEGFYNSLIMKLFGAERKDFKELFFKTKNYDHKQLRPQAER
jgi:hypothetical protein